MKGCALGLLLLLQDPVGDAVKRLTEAKAAEASAERALVELGPGALEAIRGAAGRADEAVGARLLAVVREIERRERIKGFELPAAAVSFSASKEPLADVVGRLAKEGGLALRLGTAPGKELVTADVKDATPAAAILGMCRAHGGIVPRWGREVLLDRGDPKARPRCVVDRVVLEVASASTTRASDFGVDRREELRLQIGAWWDAGLRPAAARIELTGLEGGEGKSYLDAASVEAPAPSSWTTPATSFAVTATRLPDRSVRTLASVAGVLVLEFPGDLETIVVKRPEARSDVQARSDSTALWVVSCGRNSCVLETAEGVDLRTREIVIVDEGGGTHACRVRAAPSDGARTAWRGSFTLPEEATIAELRVITATPGRVLRIPWRIEGVALR